MTVAPHSKREAVGSLEQFETERMIARRVKESDFDALCEMHRDSSVMATLGGERTTAETRAFLDRNIEHWETFGFGLWMLEARGAGELIGRGALRNVVLEGSAEIEIGYAFFPSHWGKGLATEIAGEIIALAFANLSAPSLVSFCLPTNVASRRVMEKTGGVFERDIEHAGLPHVLYRFAR